MDVGRLSRKRAELCVSNTVHSAHQHTYSTVVWIVVVSYDGQLAAKAGHRNRPKVVRRSNRNQTDQEPHQSPAAPARGPSQREIPRHSARTLSVEHHRSVSVGVTTRFFLHSLSAIVRAMSRRRVASGALFVNLLGGFRVAGPRAEDVLVLDRMIG